MSYVQDVCSIECGSSLKPSSTVFFFGTKAGIGWQTLVKICTIKFNENPCGRFVIHGQTHMENLTITFFKLLMLYVSIKME
jgi:hypothetical protein